MTDSMRLNGKVAIITGRISGIGLAVAHLFAKEGAKLVLAARGKAASAQAVAEIIQSGGEAIFVNCDMTKTAKYQEVLRVATSHIRRY